jgi:hypothetical protein
MVAQTLQEWHSPCTSSARGLIASGDSVRVRCLIEAAPQGNTISDQEERRDQDVPLSGRAIVDG